MSYNINVVRILSKYKFFKDGWKCSVRLQVNSIPIVYLVWIFSLGSNVSILDVIVMFGETLDRLYIKA